MIVTLQGGRIPDWQITEITIPKNSGIEANRFYDNPASFFNLVISDY